MLDGYEVACNQHRGRDPRVTAQEKKKTLLFTSLLMLSLKPQEACSTSLPSSAASVQFNGILKETSEVGLINNFWSAVTYGVETTRCYTFSFSGGLTALLHSRPALQLPLSREL